MLCTFDHILADGIFKSSSEPFVQLYSILVNSFVLSSTMPVVYLLLPNKYKTTYINLFNELRNMCINYGLILNPKLVTVDVERGSLDTLKNVLPNAELKGCNFYFNKAIYEKIVDLGWNG